MDFEERIRARSVNPKMLQIVGSYTSPRGFGVHRLMSSGDVGMRYRFGNHPVRMNELIRDYGDGVVEVIFLKRDDAKHLEQFLNYSA